MKSNYKEYKQLNLTETANEIRKFWEENGTFQKSLDSRDKDNSFVFLKVRRVQTVCLASTTSWPVPSRILSAVTRL